MLKDRLPESSNSADKRRPLIMVSPRDRQKRLKEDKIKNKLFEDLNNEIDDLKLALEQKEQMTSYTEAQVSEIVSKLEAEYKKEVAKLSRELNNSKKKIEEFNKLNKNSD